MSAIITINKEKIISDYLNSKSIWVSGTLNGISGQRVHYLLNKNGIDTTKKDLWTKREIDELTLLYTNDFSVGSGCLGDFCKKHNKLKSNVCRKAKEIGLKTSYNRKLSHESKINLSQKTAIRIKKNGHPKGMLGKTHTDEAKKKIGVNFKKMWASPDSKYNSEEFRQKLSDRLSKNQETRMKNNPASTHSRSVKGTVSIGGKTFFARSKWEANIAAYFEFLKSKNEIKDWEHEPETFWFLKIQRGVRSYKPDFLITRNNGTQYYEEVKGWMDNKSKTKINRMRIYYPKIELFVLGEARYKEISKNKSIIPNWGLLDECIEEKIKRLCNTEGCDKPHHSKGYCRGHFYLIYNK